MNDAAVVSATREIVFDEVLAHPPEKIWKTLTDGALVARWMMAAEGFAPVVGQRFTFRTKPAGQWDGTIRCEVLEVIPNRRFVYSWRGGHRDNAGYGSLLDTVVTWTLTPAAGGTRLHLVHSGFHLPGNETAFGNLGSGWKTCMTRIDTISGEQN